MKDKEWKNIKFSNENKASWMDKSLSILEEVITNPAPQKFTSKNKSSQEDSLKTSRSDKTDEIQKKLNIIKNKPHTPSL